MAKLTRKILGNIKGAVGDITFSDWKGQTIVKSKSEGSKLAPTAAQELTREKFKLISSLANSFSQIIPIGFMESSTNKTTYNSFFKENYPSLLGSLGTLSIDFAKVILSKGKLETIQNVIMNSTGNTISVNWNFDNFGQANDTVYIVAFHPEKKIISLNTSSTRISNSGSISIPVSWNGNPIQVYVFCNSTSGISSNSQFLGSTTLT